MALFWSCDYETNNLLSYFIESSWNNVPTAPSIVTSPVKSGTYAGKYTIPSGGSRCENVINNDGADFHEGDDHWFQWDVYLENVPLNTTDWQVFTQFKNNNTGSPPLEVVISNGVWQLSGGYSWPGVEPYTDKTDIINLGTAVAATWTTIKLHIKWSADPAIGQVDAWLNGTQVVTDWHPEGGTLYPDQTSYLKVGYYRSSSINVAASAYFDNFRWGNTQAAVEGTEVGGKPTYIGHAVTSDWNTTTSPKTTGSFACQASDLLVAVSGSSNGAFNPTISNNGTALSWTELEALTTANEPGLKAWYAFVDTDRAAMTVTFTRSATSADFGGEVTVWRNAGGIGASESRADTSIVDIPITTVHDNSGMVTAIFDRNSVDGTSRAWRTLNHAANELVYFRNGSTAGCYVAYYDDVGVAGAKTAGLTAPSAMWAVIVSIEVLGVIYAEARCAYADASAKGATTQNQQTKFYLSDTTTGLSGTLPAANTTISVMAPSGYGSTINKMMQTGVGNGQTLATYATAPTTGYQAGYIRRWLSPPLAAQTISSQNITLQAGWSESNSSSDFYPTFTLGVWRPSTGALVGRIHDQVAYGSEAGTSEGNQAIVTSGSTSVTTEDGDILVLEAWRAIAGQQTATQQNNSVYYNGTTEGSATDNAAFLSFPNAILMQGSSVSATVDAGCATATTSVDNAGIEIDLSQPPTYISSTTTAWNTTTSPKSSSSISVTAGDLLVYIGAVSSNVVLNTPTNDGAALTWSAQGAQRLASNASIAIFTARADTTRSIVVSGTTGSSARWGFSVQVWRGSDGVGNTTATNGTGAPSLSLDCASAKSAVVFGASDISISTGPGTWITSYGTPVETVYARTSSYYTNYFGYHPNVGAAGSKTVGLTAPSQTWVAAAVEVRGYSPPVLADAGAATATAAVTGATGTAASEPGVATATSAAYNVAQANTYVTATEASATSAANTAAAVVAAAATQGAATAAANDMTATVTTGANEAGVTAVAYSPGSNADAGCAAATATAYSATPLATIGAGAATATSAAANASGTTVASAGSAAVTGAANNATTVVTSIVAAECATATATVSNASGGTTINTAYWGIKLTPVA